MGSHSQRLSMEQGLLLTTLLHTCSPHPFLLDLFQPRQSGDRADSQYHAPSEYHAPTTGDSYGVPQVEEYHAPTPGDSYGVPAVPPCPSYTSTTIPPPSYHQGRKPKAPFPDVLGFLKSIPEGIHNIFKPSKKPDSEYGVPCTPQESSYSPPVVDDYSPPVVDDYAPPVVPSYNEEHDGDISINERGLLPDDTA